MQYIAQHTVKSVPTYGVAIGRNSKGYYRAGYYLRRGQFANKVMAVGPYVKTEAEARELANRLYAECVREGSLTIFSLR